MLGHGVPLDTLITNMCECSHLHPLVEQYQLKWKATTPFIRLAFLLGTGSSRGYNQWAGCKESAQVQRGWLIINKSTAAMPFMNRKAKEGTILGKYVYSRLDRREQMPEELRGREIAVKKEIKQILEGGMVEYDDGTRDKVDVIVMATGYRVSIPFLQGMGTHQEGERMMERSDGTLSAEEKMEEEGDIINHENENRLEGTGEEECSLKRKMQERNSVQDALPCWHNIVCPCQPRLAFIGFVRPNVGAIPPVRIDLNAFSRLSWR